MTISIRCDAHLSLLRAGCCTRASLLDEMMASWTAKLASAVFAVLWICVRSSVPLAPPADIVVDAEWTPNGTLVGITWAPVECCSQHGNVTNYEVFYHAIDAITGLPGETKSIMVERQQTSCTLFNLPPWKGFVFHVSAHTSDGHGVTSAGIYLSPAIPTPKGCEETTVFIEEISGDYSLPSAEVEQEVPLISCAEGVRTKAVCTWTFDGVQMQFLIQRNKSLCVEFVPEVNPRLKAINLTTVNDANALESSLVMYNFTKSVLSPTSSDLNLIANSFSTIVNSFDRNSTDISTNGLTKVSELLGGIIGNLMLPNTSIPTDDNKALDATRRLTSTMENVLRSLMTALSSPGGDDTGDPTSKVNIKLGNENAAYQVTRNSSIAGIYLCDNGNSGFTMHLLGNEADANRVCYPDATLSLPTVVRDSAKGFMSYQNSRLFDESKNTTFTAKTKVLGSVLENNKDGHLNGGAVTLQFNISAIFKDRNALKCAFWDYGISNWSFSGCNSSVNGDLVNCTCNHLTHFAVLLDWRGSTSVFVTHQEALTLITRVGLSVSTMALGLVLVSFILFRVMRRTTSQRVLFSLSLSLVCLNLCFLVGFDMVDNETLCIAMAAVTHYFLLTSFVWMLVEGLLQYLRLVKVLNTYIPGFLWKASLPAWGIPAAVVLALAISDSQHYMAYGSAKTLQQCWVSQPVLLYAVVTPVGIIVVANAAIFIMIVCSLGRRTSTRLRSNRSDRDTTLLHLRASVSVLVVLGVSWIFGLLVFDDAEDVTLAFQYLFCIFNSLQGLLIFVFHNIREPLVRKQWQKLVCPAVYNSRRDSTAMTLSSRLRSRRETSESTISHK